MNLNNLLYGTEIGSGEILDCIGPIVDTAKDNDAYGASSCVVIVRRKMDLPGVASYVRNMLYGDPTKKTAVDMKAATDTCTPSDPCQNSILGKILTGGTLTSEQQKFMIQAGPLVKNLKDVQIDISAYDTLIKNYYVKSISLALTVDMAESIIFAGDHLWDRTKGLNKPISFDERLKELKDQLKQLKTSEEVARNNLADANKLAEAVRKAFRP